MLKMFGSSDRGPVRRTNEDVFLHDVELGLLAVADGMGGHAAGEIASRLATEALVGFLRRSHQEDEYSWPYGIEPMLSLAANRLRTAVCLANRRVFRAAASHDEYTGMGTTLVCALVANGTAAIAHVGDSRLYVWTGQELRQITQDDSWAATVLGHIDAISAAQAATHPMRNVLTNVLGVREQTDIHLQERVLSAGECLLLTTDGVHGTLDNAQIASIFRETPRPEDVPSVLVSRAIAGGGRDNATALIGVYETL